MSCTSVSRHKSARKSVAEADAYLAVEGTSGLLEAEVVVEVGIGQVAALNGEVVAAALQAIAQREVMGKLVGDYVVATATDDLGVVGKRMRPLVVVSQRQQVSFSSQIVPIKVGVEVGKTVGYVGHTRTVSQVFDRIARAAYLIAFIVAHVHLREIAAQAEPASQAVAGGKVIAFGEDVAVIDVSGILFATAEVLHVALDVVVRVAVNQPAFQIERMATQRAGIAEAEVQVVAVLGSKANLPTLQVLVTEHFFDGGEAVGTLVGELGLQAGQDEVSARRTVAPGTDRAADAHIVATRVSSAIGPATYWR